MWMWVCVWPTKNLSFFPFSFLFFFPSFFSSLRNQVCVDGASTLAEAYLLFAPPFSSSYFFLLFLGAGVCVDGAGALAEALMHNHWLETMELGYNAITGTCSQHTSVCIRQHTSAYVCYCHRLWSLDTTPYSYLQSMTCADVG